MKEKRKKKRQEPYREGDREKKELKPGKET